MSTATLDFVVMQEFDHKRMRKLREEAGLTITAVAKRAKMNVSRWCDIESGGRTNITIETLGRIARALDCSSQDLLTPPKSK